jgi:hypothetical protein
MNCYKLFLTAVTTVVCFFFSNATPGQHLALPNAYAHNDYWHRRPLLDALENGFSYVEADIFKVRNKLVVAHTVPFFKNNRTLENLYLEPLRRHCSNNNAALLTLMIDIKSGGKRALKLLLPLLEKYKDILSSYEGGQVQRRQVTVIITGHKPIEDIRGMQQRFIFLDEDLRQTGTDTATCTYITASCRYSSLLSWKGEGPMPDAEKQKLLAFVQKAHDLGRKVRLWASPENEQVWAALLSCNVDLINTDKLTALRNFLLNEQGMFTKAD